MQIFIDADACPKVIKELLYRAAERRQVSLILIANQYLRIPASEFISTVQVPDGLDVADERIVELVNPDDIVITSDIPLADLVVEKGAHALNPRGTLYTPDNIKERKAVRDILSDMRSSGVTTGGPPAFGDRDKQAFANQFDKLLTKMLKKKG